MAIDGLEEHLTEPQVKLVDLVTQGRINAIKFDLDIEADRLKYSAWCSTLATAGLALLLSGADKVLPTSPKVAVNPVILALAITIPLIASAALGAWVNWETNRESGRKRLEMTFALKQQIVIYADGVSTTIGRDYAQSVMHYEFLSDVDKERLQKLKQEESKRIPGEKLLLLQQALLVTGYLAALASLFMRMAAG